MAKRCLVISPTASSSSTSVPITDWLKCIICQTDIKEKLVCPADSKRTDRFSGYASFADILPKFRKALSLPPSLCSRLLDSGDDVLNTLIAKTMQGGISPVAPAIMKMS